MIKTCQNESREKGHGALCKYLTYPTTHNNSKFTTNTIIWNVLILFATNIELFSFHYTIPLLYLSHSISRIFIWNVADKPYLNYSPFQTSNRLVPASLAFGDCIPLPCSRRRRGISSSFVVQFVCSFRRRINQNRQYVIG